MGVTREAMDVFSVRSHERLGAAIDSGKFARELAPVFDLEGNCYAEDDGLRRDSSTEKLARLKPVFDKPAGRVTAGNSAQITDGCAWLVLADKMAIQKYGIGPARPHCRQPVGRARSRPDGPWACPRHNTHSHAPSLGTERYRLLGDQRSLCGPGAGMPGGLGITRILSG